MINEIKQEKLQELFIFLKENRVYNKELQTKYYKNKINIEKDTEDKVIGLLYDIANTQSQPNIDYLSEFYRKIYNKKKELNSFKSFIKLLDQNSTIDFKGLYKSLKNHKGWGEKTAALFVKNIFHIHNGEYPTTLKIWNDVPPKLLNDDFFFLPVDTVIIAIFEELNGGKKWSFSKINKILKENFKKDDIEIWDDLWFWGFITQKGSSKSRIHEWNENKYWVIFESDKDPKTISEIKIKVELFLTIIKSK